MRALGNRNCGTPFLVTLCVICCSLAFAGCSTNSNSAPPPDTTPPTAPTNLVATAVSSTQINLTWTASTDNVGVTGYKVERCAGGGCSNFAQVATTTVTNFNDTGLTNATSYSYRVRATDAAGNLSAYSAISTAATPDTTPPSAPTNLVATAVSSTQINLTWTASTDNVGVTGYKVERCAGGGCSNFAQIATPTAPSYSDMGLTGSTSYSYRVRATDAAGNLSTFSTTSTAATAAPTFTPPSNLTATAVSSSQINLSWTAGTETGGTISQYLIERCTGAGCSNFAQIGTSTTTMFSNTGLNASTSYSYRVRETDAGNNLSGYSANVTTATPAQSPISVSLSPKRGGVVTSQTLGFTATVNNDVGGAGVSWSTTGGTLTGQTLTTATFSSTTPGSFMITAQSNADPTQSASATIGVTDLAGATTWRYDNTRAGANTHEFALTAANVNTTTFEKLFSCAVDASVYAQPLWVANLSIGGGTHNVIFVATVHDTLYAFDADVSPCKTFWQKSLLGSGETWVSSNDVGSTDITPDIGIIGTPVIDPAKTTLYVVSKSKVTGSACTPAASCHQRIHALNLANGSEEFNGPAEISAAVAGTGDGSSGGILAFDSLTENQRPALTYLNGTVYIAWASHGDNGPYHGWVIGYNAANLTQQTAVFNADPDGQRAGIWMSGNGLAADASNRLYCVTGNGTFDGTFPPVPGMDDFGDSVLELSTSAGLSLADFFTPFNQNSLNGGDVDLGSGGAVVLPDQSSGPVHLLFISSKSGTIYLINRDNMGKFNSLTDQVVQEFVASGGGFWSTPAFWQNTIYAGGSGDNIIAWPFNHNTPGQFDTTSSSSSPTGYGFPGASPVVSASGTTNGIVWAIDSSAYGVPCCANGPAVLHAYNATNLANELWNSGQVHTDQAGNAVKFTVPMVANGKVYVGTTSEISVYGLKPQ